MIILDGYNGGVGSQYGDGSDGQITITSGSVDIQDLYETSGEVLGATTKNGVDQGLGHGLGSYDPENGAFLQTTTLTIDLEATLTHGTAYGDGSVTSNGTIYIGCLGLFTNNGTISIDALGYTGGAGGTTSGGAPSGLGNSGGTGGTGGDGSVPAGAGGTPIYGDSDLPLTWDGLNVGSGGGGGGGYYSSFPSVSIVGGIGGNGGGIIRIYTTSIINTSGLISSNGGSGLLGGSAGAGAGGGGAGGSIYIETINGNLGTDTITASIGSGGDALDASGTGGGGGGGAFAGLGIVGIAGNVGNPTKGNGGNGGIGRIHITGAYTGTTSDPAIA